MTSEVRPVVRRLLAEPLVPVAKLRDDVERHLRFLTEEQHRSESLDLDQARVIATRCLALLDDLTHSGLAAPEPQRRLIQVASRYFAIADDADRELPFDGPSDDASVITAVEQLLSTSRYPPPLSR